jgi:anti-anti-sigma factor
MSDLSEALQLFITNNGPRSRLDVGGEIDLATIDELRDHLSFLVEAGIGDVEIDMAAVTFCDAAVLRVLLAVRHALDAGGRHLHIVNPSAPTVRLLQLAGLDAILLDPLHRPPQHRPSLRTPTCRGPHRQTGPGAGR